MGSLAETGPQSINSMLHTERQSWVNCPQEEEGKEEPTQGQKVPEPGSGRTNLVDHTTPSLLLNSSKIWLPLTLSPPSPKLSHP